ncbi:MAG TPA: SCO family protein [Gemmataceae bacterium]|nr:SCO family protein [Gemmataceae bacterium]
MKPLRLLLAIAVVPLTGCPSVGTPPTGTVRAEVDIPAPEFALTERSDKTVTRDDLKGKVWVASFVFTRCPGPCPQVSATMARLQKDLDLKNSPELRLVTFTVDPERDTPDELKEYANRYQADPERWLFLTGPSEAVLHKLLMDGFKVTAQRSKYAKPGDEFDHSSRLAVVDKRGTIRGYFDGMRAGPGTDETADFEDNLRQLKEMVARLLNE